MTDKEKIRAEVERRKESWSHADPQYVAGGKDVCDYLLGFIDSMTEEPVSENLEEVANKVIPNGVFTIKSSITPDDDEDAWSYEQVIEIFKTGAKWQKEQMIDKAVTVVD